MVLQLLGTTCWYRDNCITKLWALSSYLLYLYMVFIQHCFHLEQHCFHLDRQFSCSSKISNLLSRIPTQSSLEIQNSCSSWLSCTLSILLHNMVDMDICDLIFLKKKCIGIWIPDPNFEVLRCNNIFNRYRKYIPNLTKMSGFISFLLLNVCHLISILVNSRYI